MRDTFFLLEDVLKTECASKPVYYMPNPGNWGDGLIRYGTQRFLRDIGLKYEHVPPARLPALMSQPDGVVIYGGGGAWCRLWNEGEQRVRLLEQKFRVIVLPSTYENSYAFQGTQFFCRDQVESQVNMPAALFCHDMAFYIGAIVCAKGKGVGHFFRADKESSGRMAIPPGNIDISARGIHSSGISGFIAEIARYSVIHTDRLHVSIAAGLMGKEVHLYPGSYFKNRAVYLSSMRDYFDNVHFHGDAELAPPLAEAAGA